MTSLLLIDDHASARQPLAMLLALALPSEDVRQAGTAAEALERVAGVDVAVVDLALPDGDGVSLIRQLRERAPGVRILVLTSSSDRGDAARSVAAGAQAVLHKAADFEAILEAVEAVAAGRSLVTAEQRADVARLAAAPARPPRPAVTLTRREHDVLGALVAGMTDKEIAAHLGVGVETVRTHLAGIYNKLGAESRVQAVTMALRAGLLDAPKSRTEVR